MEREQLRRHGVFAGVLAVAVLATLIASVMARGDKVAGVVTLSGKDVTRTLDVRDFSAIRLRGGYDVDLEAGGDYAVEIAGDEAILDSLEVAVEDGTLRIAPEKGRRFKNSGGISLRIRLPRLDAFTVNGAVDGKLRHLASDDFALTVNGAADISIDGTCAAFSAVTNGAGDIDSRDFHCESAQVTINGAGNMKIYASKSVQATVNGVGGIDIYGNPPEVRKLRAGIGSIRVHDSEES